MALTGCTGIYVIANSGRLLDASGRAVGSRAVAQADIGRYRVIMGEIYSAPKFTVPLTYHFHFSRSPAEVARIHRVKGYRKATEADWERHRALLARALYGDKRPARNRKEQIDLFNQIIDQQRSNSATSDYETVVFPDGLVGSCKGNLVKRFCAGKRAPARAEQMRLAQIMLDKFKPGCRLGRVDPEEVIDLPGGDMTRSWEQALLVQVQC